MSCLWNAFTVNSETKHLLSVCGHVYNVLKGCTRNFRSSLAFKQSTCIPGLLSFLSSSNFHQMLHFQVTTCLCDNGGSDRSLGSIQNQFWISKVEIFANQSLNIIKLFCRNANNCIHRGGMCLFPNRVSGKYTYFFKFNKYFFETPDRRVHAGVVNRRELHRQFHSGFYCYEPEHIKCWMPRPGVARQ